MATFVPSSLLPPSSPSPHGSKAPSQQTPSYLNSPSSTPAPTSKTTPLHTLCTPPPIPNYPAPTPGPPTSPTSDLPTACDYARALAFANFANKTTQEQSSMLAGTGFLAADIRLFLNPTSPAASPTRLETAPTQTLLAMAAHNELPHTTPAP